MFALRLEDTICMIGPKWYKSSIMTIIASSVSDEGAFFVNYIFVKFILVDLAVRRVIFVCITSRRHNMHDRAKMVLVEHNDYNSFICQ